MTTHTIEQLEGFAREIRKDIVKMLLNAGSGHSAGPLGMADVFTALYYEVLKHDPANPDWEERDRFVMSNGHVAPGLYAILAHVGYFPKSELGTLRKLGTILQGHPNRLDTPGVETSSGPLGQGTSQSVGMAIGFKMDSKKNQVYCMTGDGELQEGQVWEAAMLAGNKQLDNLTWIIDRNNIQIDGYTEKINPLEPLRAKFESFNWHVISIDGNNIQAVIDACREARAIYERPVAIIANNTPGKGVEFMEDLPEWHGKPPKVDEAVEALSDLNNVRSLSGQVIYD